MRVILIASYLHLKLGYAQFWVETLSIRMYRNTRSIFRIQSHLQHRFAMDSLRHWWVVLHSHQKEKEREGSEIKGFEIKAHAFEMRKSSHCHCASAAFDLTPRKLSPLTPVVPRSTSSNFCRKKLRTMDILTPHQVGKQNNNSTRFGASIVPNENIRQEQTVQETV